jgi:hypothetical protein
LSYKDKIDSFLFIKQKNNKNMVSIIPVTNEVDNIIIANATIDDSFIYEDDLPVAVLIEKREFLVAEKLSTCFKIKEACLPAKGYCETVCYNCPKILCCFTASVACGYFLFYCPNFCFP